MAKMPHLATVYLYPDGRMVVAFAEVVPGGGTDNLIEQAKRIQEAWARGEQKAIVVGPGIDVVVIPPDIESRLARIEEVLGLVA